MWRITIRIKSKVVQWAFHYEWDFLNHMKYVLPWAFRDVDHQIVPNDTTPDFLACFCYPPPGVPDTKKFTNLCFLLCGEKHDRHALAENVYQFCQNPSESDHKNTRYSPTMCIWGRPTSKKKTKPCSVVESGKWPYRLELIEAVSRKMKTDIYKNLPGYHYREDNKKYVGIENHAFYLGIENCCLDDYITEKYFDAVLSEACPIYYGAPNIGLYAEKSSYMPMDDALARDWDDWKEEYLKRRDGILKQKEFIRTKLNFFSYFNHLTDNLNLLSEKRPITLIS